MTSLAIVDSGPLVAAANRADPAHRASLEALRRSDLRLVIPALCVAEAAYLLSRDAGTTVEARFLRALESFDVRAPLPQEWLRMAELVERYSDLRLGAADASVVTLAERLETDLLITLDRRHFAVVRPRHFEGFRLLPDH